MSHTLALTHSFEPIGFVTERKLACYLSKEKVEIVSEWSSVALRLGQQLVPYPATVRFKHPINYVQRYCKFNKRNIFRRDRYSCQYCGKICSNSRLTIDHIVPKSKGGKDSWQNCVAACSACNNKKGNSLLEDLDMKLIRDPTAPRLFLPNEHVLNYAIHITWDNFIPTVVKDYYSSIRSQ